MTANSLSTVYKKPEEIAVEYENNITELNQKQADLIKVKDEFKEKEFKIKYVDDVNFKELYGRANDDTRDYHVRTTLKDLYDKKNSLETEIEYLKMRISFLKAVLYLKIKED